MKTLVALGLLIAAAVAQAQQWPTKPVRIIIPNSAGSAPDVIARLAGERLGKSLGQSVVIDNRPGANGFIAAESVAKAAPDGYTLLLATQDIIATNLYRFKSVPYDPDRDFTPVANLIDSAAFVVAVHPDLPVRSYPEMVSYAKARPGKTTIGVTSGISQLLGRFMNATAGTDTVLITYKSTPQSVQEALGQQITFLNASVPSIEPLIKSGRLRVIAVSSTRRFPTLPDVPTLNESYPGLIVEGWLFLVAPRGTPQPVVQRMNREVDIVLKDQEVVQRIQSFGFSSSDAMTADGLAERIRTTRSTWKKIAQELQLQNELQ